MSAAVEPFPGAEGAVLVTLVNARGTKLCLSNFGARIVGLELRGRDGKPRSVVTRFASTGEYMGAGRYHGAVIGRYANRIGRARFMLNGKSYPLYANDGKNSLHGGQSGFDARIWECVAGEDSAQFYRVSPDMEEGYPGAAEVSVRYTLTDSDEVKIEYLAQAGADTVMNLTNHVYFNLDGFEGDGTVLGHTVEIAAQSFTEVDKELIPTGRILSAAGTALDFTSPRRIGERINAAELAPMGGYDHNFCIEGKGMRRCARVASEVSGIAMEVYSDMPGMQLYSGNFLNGEGGYKRHGALCLETQFYPDSPNNGSFPSAVLHRGEWYRHMTVYRFTV